MVKTFRALHCQKCFKHLKKKKKRFMKHIQKSHFCLGSSWIYQDFRHRLQHQKLPRNIMVFNNCILSHKTVKQLALTTKSSSCKNFFLFNTTTIKNIWIWNNFFFYIIIIQNYLNKKSEIRSTGWTLSYAVLFDIGRIFFGTVRQNETLLNSYAFLGPKTQHALNTIKK